MNKQFTPLGTLLCGIAAVEQLGHELALRGVAHPVALCNKSDQRKALRLLRRVTLEPAAGELLLCGTTEELPSDTDCLILIGAHQDSSSLAPPISVTVHLPLNLEQLDAVSPAAESMIVIDQRYFPSAKKLETWFRHLYRKRFGAESSYPFLLHIPVHFLYAATALLYHGEGVIGRLAELLKNTKVEHPLLITDKGIVAAGILKRITDSLPPELDLAISDAVPPDSDMQLVDTLTTLFLEQKRDSLIALGGGSVIDSARSDDQPESSRR